MTEEVQPLKYPLADINPDQKQALYISILERKVQYQSTLMLQYRTLLEALTGEAWDQIDTRLKKGEMMRIATNAFERNLARDLAEAERMVQANLDAANAPYER
ncbi:hypothetical protein BI084_gp26 [Gordonia phage Terapin]|uniref:Minor tail protein n=4 Tax=Terapinvirus terapin TaxID=2734283 RepID=A0A345MB66_9CAUD|nr:hypothetical protein BI084_gp26 [Gordonia phage Terapin]AOE44838.1 hypothetical protein SEA_TERAPIN_26 [Gordonia phage Terapin]AVP43303.1 hypothetical protein PBI_DJOKOVIC_26 [Gordonia phage Djokovic]AXH67737.1 minor tail protein [Gordonia phage Beyoncage]QOC56596.1 hypothetical protein SEA_BITESIZE_26 [Gordonia phage BiteSize]